MGPKRSQTSRGSKRSQNSRGPKRSRVSREDRISTLPDTLLLVILSFLPFGIAVRTCVLSKRWRHLCMGLPHLCLVELGSRLNFNNFIDRVLMHRPVDLSIEKFDLILHGVYDHTLINQWIRKALEHQVRDFTLRFNYSSGSYELIPDIYTYGSFETLRLELSILVDIPSNVSFRRLKVLEFRNVTFSNYESVQDLLLKCPVLENLVISQCSPLSGDSCLTVCGSALKNLNLHYYKPVNRDTPLKIVIDTPGLEDLKIEDTTLANISIKGAMLSLRTANIDVGIEQLQVNNSVFQLLGKIIHVRCLTLKYKAIGALDRASHYSFPTFHNLIQLELSAINWSCWNLLPRIIASSPNLQSLLLPWGVDTKHTRRKNCYGLWNTPKFIPQCLSSNLKTITIGMFNGTGDELSLLDYLLLEGKVLSKISIYCKPWIQKKVLTLGSKTCKVHFI